MLGINMRQYYERSTDSLDAVKIETSNSRAFLLEEQSFVITVKKNHRDLHR